MKKRKTVGKILAFLLSVTRLPAVFSVHIAEAASKNIFIEDFQDWEVGVIKEATTEKIIGQVGNLYYELYIGDKESSLPRPIKELKGFNKVYLQAGESRDVTFTITAEDLSFFDDKQHKWIAETGEFTAYIAASAEDIRSTIDFRLK